VARPPLASTPGRSSSGFGANVNDERRCLIIDKQPTIRLGVRGLLASRYEVEEATDGRDALGLITSVGDFDVAIVELASANGEALTGLPAIRALRKARPALGIVAHSLRPEHHEASEAVGAGALAYVAKSSPASVLETAVDAAAEAEDFIDPAARRNGHSITPRQRQILQLYANGLSTENAAQRLGVSTETVRTHTKAVLARLSARDRAHAVAIGIRSSLIE
jgi:two-component system, NarL family, response regulator